MSETIEMNSSLWSSRPVTARPPELEKCLKSVLVVDDDPCLRPVLENYIARIHPQIQIDWMESADAFLDSEMKRWLKPGLRYDLVLTDIYMPGRHSGFDVWNYFAKEAPATPVVMMSGLTMYEYFKQMGYDVITPAYLSKPLDFAECQATVGGLLFGRKP